MTQNSTGPRIQPTRYPTPPCATWEIWRGGEIEGEHDLGVKTLFIRSLPEVLGKTAEQIAFIQKRANANRVWLCREFLCWCSSTAGAWESCRALLSLFPLRCLEVTESTMASIPTDILRNCRVYVKVNIPSERLKAGDVVCVGPPFHDEAFTLGKGVKVDFSAYLKDTKIR